ncbi:DUF6241 domain-containing protein [Bacillus spongiae]|uniref:DUF6241 domain-containing protein n=1 Tax=Bacillus spongiae TaxID=2683610 RepID=A0ABU8HCR9_9BACI
MKSKIVFASILIITATILIFVIIGIDLVNWKENEHANKQKVEQEHQLLLDETISEEEEINKEEEEKEVEEQTKNIGGELIYELDLDSSSTQEEVIEIMHNMTHQKVKAEKKWGAIPMSDNTINQVYEFISTSNFSKKDDLLRITEKWKNGDFSSIVQDHNYFWEYQGGTVGKAYGVMSSQEEATFIENNFKDE